jgi:hypothetical protein
MVLHYLLVTLSLCVVLCAYLLHCARLLLCLGPAVIYLAIYACSEHLDGKSAHAAWLVGEGGGFVVPGLAWPGLGLVMQTAFYRRTGQYSTMQLRR